MCDSKSRPGEWNAWLTLFRPPNLFTVPGDPLAGAMLAYSTMGVLPIWSSIALTIGASVLFYAAGLLANDVLDRDIDARERPDRPIPSGAVRPGVVLLAAILLTLGGLLLSFRAGHTVFIVGSLTALAVWFYNGIGKRIAPLAFLSMGLCRGLSLLLGAAVFGKQGVVTLPVIMSFLFLSLTVALITWLARHETDHTPGKGALNGPARWSIPLATTAWLSTALCVSPHPVQGLSLGLAAMSVLWAAVWIRQANRSSSPRAIQAAVGALIRGLLLSQAALCATTGADGQGVALLLLAGFPVSGWLGKWFYGS